MGHLGWREAKWMEDGVAALWKEKGKEVGTGTSGIYNRVHRLSSFFCLLSWMQTILSNRPCATLIQPSLISFA